VGAQSFSPVAPLIRHCKASIFEIAKLQRFSKCNGSRNLATLYPVDWHGIWTNTVIFSRQSLPEKNQRWLLANFVLFQSSISYTLLTIMVGWLVLFQLLSRKGCLGAQETPLIPDYRTSSQNLGQSLKSKNWHLLIYLSRCLARRQ